MRLGRAEVTPGFLLLLAWANYLDRQLLLPMILTACVCHELGHYTVIRLLGNNIKGICLSAIGASIPLVEPFGYISEILASAAGPGVNLLLARIFSVSEVGTIFAGINLVLAGFNLLPIGSLDGGRIFNCSMSLLLGPYHADRIKFYLDRILGLMLISAAVILFLRWGNPTLLLGALWLNLSVFSEKCRN